MWTELYWCWLYHLRAVPARALQMYWFVFSFCFARYEFSLFIEIQLQWKLVYCLWIISTNTVNERFSPFVQTKNPRSRDHTDFCCGGGDLVAKTYLTLCNHMDCSRQAPLSMRFSRWEYWSGLPLPSAVDLPDPDVNPWVLHWQADSLSLSHQETPLVQCISTTAPLSVDDW